MREGGRDGGRVRESGEGGGGVKLKVITIPVFMELDTANAKLIQHLHSPLSIGVKYACPYKQCPVTRVYLLFVPASPCNSE